MKDQKMNSGRMKRVWMELLGIQKNTIESKNEL